MIEDGLTFGTIENGVEYIRRLGVYAVIFNEETNKVAIMKVAEDRYFLPGGGIEGAEDHEQCLKREALEEMGREIYLGPFIGRAKKYYFSTRAYDYFLNDGYFYICQLGKVIFPPIEQDHQLVWLEIEEALKLLFHDHQKWAITQALKMIETDKK